MIALHNGDFTGPFATGAVRKKESVVIQLPPVSGKIEVIWLFFASEKRGLCHRISISVFKFHAFRFHRVSILQ
jgi:hypothetical protein